MNNSCERKVTYGLVDAKGQRAPYLFRYEERPLLDTSRLPACLQKPVELSLSLVTARNEIISTMLHRRPLHFALAIATGTLAFGVMATAVTHYLLSK